MNMVFGRRWPIRFPKMFCAIYRLPTLLHYSLYVYAVNLFPFCCCLCMRFFLSSSMSSHCCRLRCIPICHDATRLAGSISCLSTACGVYRFYLLNQFCMLTCLRERICSDCWKYNPLPALQKNHKTNKTPSPT